jgi:glucokinase
MRILAADVGGTNTRVALFSGPDVELARYESAAHAGIAPILAGFLRGRSVDAAMIAVAGPVVDGVCRTTNLPWHLDALEIGRDTGIARVGLVNDFEATALGLGELGEGSLAVLQDRPVDPDAPCAVLGAGTGLGEAILIPTGGLPRVLPTEGGHCDLAPRDETEIELLRFLQRRHARVSYERVLSGPGIEALYEFVAGDAAEPVDAAIIGERALDGSDPACVRAIELFVSLYGAEAGNLALKTLPFGGLFVAGGIAPKLLPLIQRGEFMRAFLAKGRMQPILDRVRVSVVLDDRVGLLGARRLALSSPV